MERNVAVGSRGLEKKGANARLIRLSIDGSTAVLTSSSHIGPLRFWWLKDPNCRSVVSRKPWLSSLMVARLADLLGRGTWGLLQANTSTDCAAASAAAPGHIYSIATE